MEISPVIKHWFKHCYHPTGVTSTLTRVEHAGQKKYSVVREELFCCVCFKYTWKDRNLTNA